MKALAMLGIAVQIRNCGRNGVDSRMKQVGKIEKWHMRIEAFYITRVRRVLEKWQCIQKSDEGLLTID